jgi:tetratricopeptide (TPR) repeat protein
LRRALGYHQCGERELARAGYDAVLLLAPGHPDALHLKGVLAHEAGEHEVAVGLIRSAIEADARAAAFHVNLGNALQALGRMDDAIASFQAGLSLDPNSPETFFNLGQALLRSGRLDEAVTALRRTVELRPTLAAAHLSLGAALHDLGSFEAATASYRRVLQLEPAHVVARLSLGALLEVQGKHAEALEEYTEAEVGRPDDLVLQGRIGSTLLAAERWPEAITRYQGILDREPSNGEAWLGLGLAYRGAGNPSDARGAMARAVELQPDSPQAVFQLAMVLTDLAAFLEAGRLFQQALALRPDWPEAHFNLGNALRLLGRDEEASASYRRALAIRPTYEGAHWNLSLSLLRQGRLAEGWEEHEWRWDASLAGGKRPFPQPLWDGASGADLQVLVWREQGIGDEIMFASCLPDLLARVGQVIYACHPKLRRLFQRSFPTVEFWDDLSVVDPAALTVTHQTPVGSLPRFLRSSIGQFPAHTGYLTADPARVGFWRQRLAALGAGPWVGISWRSRLMGSGRAEHYTRLEDWGPIFGAAAGRINFVNLQYDDCAAELAEVTARTGIIFHQFADLDLYNDLDEVAALMTALDLVLAPDNSVGEQAAALGRPIWRLDSGVDWSTLGTDHRPWQPSMRLFRRGPGGQWTDVIHAVSRALGEWVREQSGGWIHAA